MPCGTRHRLPTKSSATHPLQLDKPSTQHHPESAYPSADCINQLDACLVAPPTSPARSPHLTAAANGLS